MVRKDEGSQSISDGYLEPLHDKRPNLIEGIITKRLCSRPAYRIVYSVTKTRFPRIRPESGSSRHDTKTEFVIRSNSHLPLPEQVHRPLERLSGIALAVRLRVDEMLELGKESPRES